MNSRKLTLLAALSVAVIAVALLVSHHRSGTQAGVTADLLYPKLQGELDSVSKVSIYTAGDEHVELARQDKDWVVTDRGGYPADAAKVHRLLRGLAKLKPIEQKTSNPENYPAIGVQDVNAPGATGARVELAGTATPVNLIVGKTGAGGQSVFVRRADEPASWLVSESIEAPASADAWLSKDILNVAFDRVQSASVDVAGKKAYTVAKKSRDAAEFAVEGVPKGKELSSPSAASSFGSALSGLTLADVKPAMEFDAAKPAAHATFRTFDGLVVDLDGWTKDDKHYIALKPSYDEALAKQFPLDKPAEDSKPENGEGTPPPAPTVDAKAEAQSAQARVDGWVYEIPDYKYEALFKPMDELLKK